MWENACWIIFKHRPRLRGQVGFPLKTSLSFLCQMMQSPNKPQGPQVKSELAGRNRHFEIFCQIFPYNPPLPVKRCIRWPESHDRMAGSARPAISFELIAGLSLCFQLVPKGHVLSQVMGSWWSVDLWISLQWFQVHCLTNWDGSFAFSSD